jgi:hypothetical protein
LGSLILGVLMPPGIRGFWAATSFLAGALSSA